MNDFTPADDHSLQRLAMTLGERLQDRGWSLSLAESCTGGWIAKCVTDIAGSSAWFERGWVSYSNGAKTEELGVSAELIAREGAVSDAVTAAMAQGAQQRSGSVLALAVSGVAGPGGATPDKPVGMVSFGLAGGEGVRSWTHQFAGDREAVRRATVAHALQSLIDEC